MLNSKQLMRISSLLRLLAWLVDVTNPSEIDDLAQRCENEARLARQNEMIEEPEWMKGAPWNDLQ